MYPEEDIPVYQLSVDKNATPQECFEIGKKLKSLRNENILIMGSGNVVHNLGMIDFEEKGGYDWAYEFDDFIKENIEKKNFERILNYTDLGQTSKYAVPITDHFNPLLYILGTVDDKDKVEIFNNKCMAGSMSMTSYIFQSE